MMTVEDRRSMEKVAQDIAPPMAVVQEILHERVRQICEEGWDLKHDDSHDCGEMADAAACYALGQPNEIVMHFWPWDVTWWKPTDRRRNLVKAGALIVAELERIDRFESKEDND